MRKNYQTIAQKKQKQNLHILAKAWLAKAWLAKAWLAKAWLAKAEFGITVSWASKNKFQMDLDADR